MSRRERDIEPRLAYLERRIRQAFSAAGATISTSWDRITGKPATFAPEAHASNHEAAGSDPLTLDFPDLGDTPSDYVGQGGKLTRVNVGATGLEFVAPYAHPNHTGPVTSTGDGATAVTANAITNIMLADMETARIKGRVTAATGDPEDLTATQARTILNVANGANNYTHPNHSGDVTSVADGATTIAVNVVTNAKAADMAASTIKGRALDAGTGDPTDLTATQVRSILDTDGLYVALTGDQTVAGVKTFSSGLISQAPSATAIPVIVQGAASQSAALQEWRNNAGTVLARVGPTGELSAVGHQTNNNNVAVQRGFNIGSMADAEAWTVDISNLQEFTSYGMWLRFTAPSSTASQVAIREWHFGARTASGAAVTAYYPGSPTVSVGAGTTFNFAVSSPSNGVLRVTITNNTGASRPYCSALVGVQWGYTSVTASNRPVIG